jgi:2,4-dienoyl-CoA reductase-like NADH-dependent reductase (Old Yellow Enzyme family)
MNGEAGHAEKAENANALLENGKQHFPKLFSPLNLNGVELSNRLFFPSMGVDLGDLDGTFSSRMEEFYDGIVASGCGLVVLSNATVSPDSVLQTHGLRLYEDRHIDALGRFCARAADRGVVVGIQLQHYGGQATTIHTKKPVLTPSGIPSPSSQRRDPAYQAKEMSLHDIDRVRSEFVHSARLALRAGARFVQFQASNGYLLSSFLSPRTNRRQDAYGGNPEKRARLLVEIVEEVRAILGRGVALGVRLGIDDCMGPEGLVAEDLKDVVPLLEDAGVDLLEASIATAETFSALFERTPEMELHFQQQVKKVKGYAKVPVGFAGFIDSVEKGEQLVAGGVADMIGMARALFADNDLILKTLAGREDAVHKCLWDGNCFRDKSNPAFDRVYCCVNPKYKRPVLPSAAPDPDAHNVAHLKEETNV